MKRELIERLLDSRAGLARELQPATPDRKIEEEGGCGVVGFCCSHPAAARHIYEPSRQMHNRGNGKGGGIAALGFVPEQLGVSREVLEDCYMLHVAFLDAGILNELEGKYITPYFEVRARQRLDTVDDWTAVEGLEARPPDVYRYFVRARADALDAFIEKNKLNSLPREAAEAEFINQNSVRLNQEYYASLGEQKAFVMSEGRNIMILKVVGYAEAIVKYYKIEELRAHVWIAHQRFPTKGRVWHPGGAHPFGGINAALVHNGDFANYHSVCEYLAERHIHPQFLTDTEASILMFDLLQRTYGYPLEYIIEALAPTSELDFDRLPQDRQSIYRAIQTAHIHGSPDGPWFFIIARSLPESRAFQLMGITDTAMLRPQVFAFCDGDVQVGLIASEKQAIDATLQSLHADDSRICPVADRYWNARGGSHTDGGAFIFDLKPDSGGRLRISCTDKFGAPVPLPSATESCDFSASVRSSNGHVRDRLTQLFEKGDAAAVFAHLSGGMGQWSFDDTRSALSAIVEIAADRRYTAPTIEVLTLLNDRRYPAGAKKRNHVIHLVRGALRQVFDGLPGLDGDKDGNGGYRLIDHNTHGLLRPPRNGEAVLVINARGFDAEGLGSDASLLMDAYNIGWRRFISYNCSGQRFIGCGLGPVSDDATIDVYGSSGDYLASGIDGLTINVHGNAQDQVGQIIKSGVLVIHGDVGQTFMYGAKGGSVYVMGNAAGRPLINSVGRPRVVINGTCLDFLGESFMAGDVFNGGGFVILNGVAFDDEGRLQALKEPYPGSNLFSLASGGAIYIRDPRQQVVWQQLNGCGFYRMTDEDWQLILPYLQENERLFGIRVEDLLTVDGRLLKPSEVYRKVAPVRVAALGKKSDSAALTETELLTVSTGE
ncbi:MAG: glutamate synthase [Dehalococcoidia bacterium]|jgi:glutamate synthase domain-containing protein 1/glutamate synthase domain-containing protein 3